MELEVKIAGSRADFELAGHVDERGSTELKTRYKSLDFSVVKEIYIDLTRVTHIGSAGIGKLLLFYKDVAVRGGTISVKAGGETYDLLVELRLDTLFNVVMA